MGSSESSTGKSILVVDNEADTRSFLKDLLARHGYLITEAGDGQEALGLLSDHNFDLMILDMLMPGVSGLEVLMNLKRQKRFRQMPVISLTAIVSKDTKKACEAGALICMLKPLNNATIQVLVKNLLDDKLTDEMKEKVIIKLAKQAPSILCHSSITVK